MSAKGEPVRALILTLCISECAVLMGELLFLELFSRAPIIYFLTEAPRLLQEPVWALALTLIISECAVLMGELLLFLGPQSFTSLMAYLCQDINGGFVFSTGALMEHFLEGIAPLRQPQMRRVTNTYLLF